MNQKKNLNALFVGENTDANSAAMTLAENIEQFLLAEKTAGEYAAFVRNIFKETIAAPADDPVWKLLDYLESDTDFYTAPASTRFHGSKKHGLVMHSLLVLAKGIKFAPTMLAGNVEIYFLTLSCLFHDFCKIGMYEIKVRNSKNEKTGSWEDVQFYKVKEEYLSFGHGVESMLRLNKYIAMPEPWNHAIRWHMGAYDLSYLDKFSYEKALATYKEVLFLHTADMQAGLIDGV
ncbi:MAG: hydrolase [Spirochaetes bacterium]|nr:hydrolase [Spirochaetota bacterium]